jgi:hypothetical protein
MRSHEQDAANMSYDHVNDIVVILSLLMNGPKREAYETLFLKYTFLILPVEQISGVHYQQGVHDEVAAHQVG